MKNKKGFTLIELLAILVILAIISLIAIPVVLNIIDKVRESSYARSADNILDASRLYFKETQIDSTMSIEGNNYNKVMESISGRKPDSGEIYIKKNGEIALALKYDKYCYKKGYSDNAITQTESEECTLAAELDENAPTITAKETSVTIDQGTSKEITSYFNIDANGASGVKSTVCTSDKDGNVTNTSSLTVNTHTITCTVTKNNNKSANASITIIVEEKELTATDIVNGLNLTTVTTGDGLYLDSDGVYRYKGSNPNNYIMLGSEEYRIMAIESQGIKVIRSSSYTNSKFDAENNRPSSTNTYCTYGYCNIWSPANEINQNGVVSDTITNGTVSGTVTTPSTAYTVLHDTYYSNLSSVDKYIVKNATWNVGPVTYASTMLLTTVKDEENNWTWNGKIGLMTYSEYIQAQSPSSSGYSSCSSNIYNNYDCGTDNWLKPVSTDWTITPRASYSHRVWVVFSYGNVGHNFTTYSNGLSPVAYLSSDIKLQGTGTQGSGAFTIVES